MLILAKLIGVLFVGLGIAFLVKPVWMTQVMQFWKEGNRIYWAGIIRVIIAIVLFLAAPAATNVMAPIILGLIILLSGVVIFVMGPEKLKALIQSWEDQNVSIHRLLSLIITSFGLLVFFIL